MSHSRVVAGFRNSGLAHLSRSLHIADLLREVVLADVVLLATAGKQRLLHELDPKSSREFETVEDWPEAQPMDNSFYDANVLRTEVKRDVAILRRLRPRLVLADHRPSLYIAAEHLGIPWILIETAARCRYFKGTFGMPPDPEPSTRNAVRMQWREFNRRLVGDHFKQVLVEFGIDETPDSINAIGKPVRILLPDIPLPGNIAGGPNESVTYLGVCSWHGFRRLPLADPVREMLRTEPILISFGGTMFEQERVNSLVEAIEKRGLNAVCVTGQQLATPNGPCSRNVVFLRFGPLDQLVRACRVQICHGGHLTVLTALAAGTASVCIPYNHDQLNTAVLTASAGCGVAFNTHQHTNYAYSSIASGARAVRSSDVVDAAYQLASRAAAPQLAEISSWIGRAFSEERQRDLLHRAVAGYL